MSYREILKRFWRIHLIVTIIGASIITAGYCAMALLVSRTIPIYTYTIQFLLFAVVGFFGSIYISSFRSKIQNRK